MSNPLDELFSEIVPPEPEPEETRLPDQIDQSVVDESQNMKTQFTGVAQATSAQVLPEPGRVHGRIEQ
jgi:hypothetical protein